MTNQSTYEILYAHQSDANCHLIQRCLFEFYAFILIFYIFFFWQISGFHYLFPIFCFVFLLCEYFYDIHFIFFPFAVLQRNLQGHAQWVTWGFAPMCFFSLSGFYIIFSPFPFCCCIFSVLFAAADWRLLQPVANISTHLLCLAYFIMMMAAPYTSIYKCCSHSSSALARLSTSTGLSTWAGEQNQQTPRRLNAPTCRGVGQKGGGRTSALGPNRKWPFECFKVYEASYYWRASGKYCSDTAFLI